MGIGFAQSVGPDPTDISLRVAYVTAFGSQQGQPFKTSPLHRSTGLASRPPWALDRT